MIWNKQSAGAIMILLVMLIPGCGGPASDITSADYSSDVKMRIRKSAILISSASDINKMIDAWDLPDKMECDLFYVREQDDSYYVEISFRIDKNKTNNYHIISSEIRITDQNITVSVPFVFDSNGDGVGRCAINLIIEKEIRSISDDAILINCVGHMGERQSDGYVGLSSDFMHPIDIVRCIQ